jgi:hypothetical protein
VTVRAPTHTSCHHRRYLLTCDDYENLRQRACGRCEICGVPVEETSHRMLYIDHDCRRGHWAVRGMLCTSCNTILGDGTGVLRTRQVIRYLASSWVDERFGDAVVPKPEPPIGSLAGIPGRRRWVRRGALWYGLGNYRGTGTASWGVLNWRYGPHRLVITHPPIPGRLGT